MKQFTDACSLTDGIAWQMNAKRVTWRRHGRNGEHRRPIIHRFEVPNGVSVIDAMADNIMTESSLMSRIRAGAIAHERCE